MDDYTPTWGSPVVAKTEKLAKAIPGVLEAELSNEKNQPVSLSVHPAGSFLLRTAVLDVPRSHAETQAFVGATFDISVQIPESMCSAEDVQDGHYFQKRSQFLRQLKRILSSDTRLHALIESADLGSKEGTKIVAEIVRWRGEEHRDVLQVEWGVPVGDEELDVHGRIVIYPRPVAAPAKVSAAKAVKKHPVYSSLLLEDFLMPELFKRAHKRVSNCSALAEAIVTVKAWAIHVGLAPGCTTHPVGDTVFAQHNALHGAATTAMMLKLYDDGIINGSMSTENCVRAFWVQLSRGYFLVSAADGVAVPTLTVEGNHLNILHRNTTEFFQEEVKVQAEAALRLTTSIDVLTHRGYTPPTFRFDAVIRIDHLPKVQPEAAGSLSTTVSARAEWSRKLHDVIKKGLGSRCTAVHADFDSAAGTAFVGVNVTNESDGRSRVIRGPPIEQKEEVKVFNEFWPEAVTSTRQFADGGIFRCVVLNDDSADKGVPTTVGGVLRDIVAVIASKHFGDRCTVSVPSDAMVLPVLNERMNARWMDAASVAAHPFKAVCAVVLSIFNGIGANALPCDLTDFTMISENARETAVFHPREHAALLFKDFMMGDDALLQRMDCSPRIEPIHCVCVIDDKGKIPDNIDAIAKMKAALLVQLSKVVVERANRGSKDAKQPEAAKYMSQLECFVTRTSLDVVCAGFLFRVYLGHYREVSLLKALQRTAEATVIERKLFHAGKHAKFIKSIVKGYPSYAHSVRLANRWISAMMLSDYVLPEVAELLLGFVYQTKGNLAPKTPGGGFYAFLQLLAMYPWSSHPLVYPYVDGAKALAKREEHEATLDKANKGMMWIAAPYADEESPFTSQTPRPAVLKYLTTVAQAALASLVALSTQSEITQKAWSSVWKVDTNAVYDITAKFASRLPLRWDRCISVELANIVDVQPIKLMCLDEHTSEESRSAYLAKMIEFDPANHAIRAIRARCRDVSMIMCDALGPQDIGIILLAPKPKAAKVEELFDLINEISAGALCEIKMSDKFTALPAAAATETDVEASKKRPKQHERKMRHVDAQLKHKLRGSSASEKTNTDRSVPRKRPRSADVPKDEVPKPKAASKPAAEKVKAKGVAAKKRSLETA